MLAGKIVPNLKCGCGKGFSAFVRASDDWQTKCPDCGEPVHAHQTTLGNIRFYGNRRFAGSEAVSRTEGYRPWEVEAARKGIPGYQHCIRDSGEIVFSDRAEQRGFMRAQQAWHDRIRNGAMAPSRPD